MWSDRTDSTNVSGQYTPFPGASSPDTPDALVVSPDAGVAGPRGLR